MLYLRMVWGLLFPTRVDSIGKFIEALKQRSALHCVFFLGSFEDRFRVMFTDGSVVVFLVVVPKGEDRFLWIWEYFEQLSVAGITVERRDKGIVQRNVELHIRDKRREKALQEIKQLHPDLYADLDM